MLLTYLDLMLMKYLQIVSNVSNSLGSNGEETLLID